MKRRDLEQHLHAHNCVVHRQGGKHEIWINRGTSSRTPIPRSTELKKGTVASICRKLQVPRPDNLA